MADTESWEVIKLIQRYPETVLQAAEKYEPSVIAKHAIKLAQAFNKYYANVKILAEDAEKDARLALVYAVTTLLKKIYGCLVYMHPTKCNKKAVSLFRQGHSFSNNTDRSCSVSYKTAWFLIN